MIRHTTDTEWILIPQNAHAESCGVMAEQLNPHVVAVPSQSGITGITLHDCGWPLHDDSPTIDETGQPTHVFHTPAALVTRLWTESARRAAQRDPYAGLLASIHGLHLVAFALQAPRDRQTVFDLNKFQHAQIEFQEHIRERIGMRTDRPMQNGLAKPGIDPAEDGLIRDYRTLRALDQISLAALCSDPLFENTMFQSLTSTTATIPIAITRRSRFELMLNPWPFKLSRIDISVPAKRIPIRQFLHEGAFKMTYIATRDERIEFHLLQS